MKKIKIEKGERFGRLTVINELPKPIKRRTFECVCDCGNTTVRTLAALRKKGTSSCGCFHNEYNNSEKLDRRTENHNYLNTRLYSIWSDMKKRCSNKNSRAYKWYGAKGVKVCDQWKNRFLNFHKWANANGYKSDLTIDRIESNGNYEPSNCRWIPWSEQNNNKTNSRIVEFKGESMTVMDLSKRTGVKYTTIIGRLNRGCIVKEAVL